MLVRLLIQAMDIDGDGAQPLASLTLFHYAPLSKLNENLAVAYFCRIPIEGSLRGTA